MFFKIFSFLKLIRPFNVLLTFLVIIVAALISTDDKFFLLKIILAAVSGSLTAAAGNIINDIYDKEADKINHPERVLPAGLISEKEAVIFYLLLVIASVSISLFINLTAFITMLISQLLLYFYSQRIKKIPLAGNFTVALLTGLAFIYGGIAVNNPDYVIIPALFAFLINFVREIVKDMEDIEGDIKTDVKTFPVKSGIRNAKKIILILSILLIALTFHPYIFGIYKIEYFIFIMIVVNPLIIYSLRSLFKNHSVENLSKISFILKLNMVFGLIAIYIGK